MEKRKISDKDYYANDRSPDHQKKEKKDKKEKKEKKGKKDKKDKKSKKQKQNKKFVPATQISHHDFATKTPEFSSWLSDTHQTSLYVLDQPQLQKRFSEFVDLWNNGELSLALYGADAREQSVESGALRKPETKYKWKFKLNETDQSQMKELSKEISSSNTNQKSQRQSKSDSDSDEETRRQREYVNKKNSDKKFLKEKDQILEELVPKKEGRERMLEKRKMKGEYAKPQGDQSVELDDSQIFGGDSDKQRLLKQIERQKMLKEQAQTKKQQETEQKLQAYKKKENDTMAPFLELIQSGNYTNPLK